MICSNEGRKKWPLGDRILEEKKFGRSREGMTGWVSFLGGSCRHYWKPPSGKVAFVGEGTTLWNPGADLDSTVPRCVCRNVKDMGMASRMGEYLINRISWNTLHNLSDPPY